MRRLRQLSVFGLFCLVLSQPVASSEVDIETADLQREELVARIIAAGTSASDDRRTGVEIDGCMVKTFAHEPYKDLGWTLYTLFEFDLGMVQSLEVGPERGGALYLEDESTVLVFFRTVPPYKALHEVPSYRNPKDRSKKSDRAGAVDYFISDSSGFFIRMKGVSGPEQGRDLALGLMRLRSEYCLPSSS